MQTFSLTCGDVQILITLLSVSFYFLVFSVGKVCDLNKHTTNRDSD